jgi:hypothetical protein
MPNTVRKGDRTGTTRVAGGRRAQRSIRREIHRLRSRVEFKSSPRDSILPVCAQRGRPYGFDGYGDEGQIKNIEVKAGEQVVAMPARHIESRASIAERELQPRAAQRSPVCPRRFLSAADEEVHLAVRTACVLITACIIRVTSCIIRAIVRRGGHDITSTALFLFLSRFARRHICYSRC